MNAQLKIATFDEKTRWRHLFGSAFAMLGDNVRQVAPADAESIARTNTDVLVVSHEWDPEWRIGIASVQRRGVPVVSVMDGVIEWSYIWDNQSYIRPGGTFQQPLLADYLCVLGRQPARYLASLGNGSRIRIIGLPRLQPPPAQQKRSEGARRVLVATARTLGHNVAQKVMVQRALRDLLAWFADRPAITPIWRISPELARELGVSPSAEQGFQEALSNCDAVAAFTSTVLLESMRCGIPTAQIDYRDVPLLVQTAWTIRAAEQIESVLHEMLHPPPHKLAFQSFCCAEELLEGDGSERLGDVIREAASGSKSDAQNSARSDFGPLDFRLVHSEISAFSIAPLSVVQAELEATYRTLDKARAEIRRLKSDLAWAHQEVEARGARLFQSERDVATLHARLGDLLTIQASHAAVSTAVTGLEIELKRRRVEEQIARLERLAEEIRVANPSALAVCGAGEAGSHLVRMLQARRVTVTCVTDGNAAKWGTLLHSVAVVGLEQAVLRGVTSFAIASFSFRDEIHAEIVRLFEGGPTQPEIFSP